MNCFTEEIKEIWKEQLFTLFYDIRKNCDLPIPYNCNFVISETTKNWGEYRSDNSSFSIIISKRLLDNFNLGAVRHVLAHEMSHLIVDKVFKMNELKSHGEAFKRACKALDVDFAVTVSKDKLLQFDGEYAKKQAITSKIKKLIKLSESSNLSESTLAFKKAQELMIAHNIKSLDTNKKENYFSRPVGPVYKKMPNYIRFLINFIDEHYFVNSITIHTFGGRRNDFFGLKENLDIAEYVFYCLLNQSERLWKEFKAEKRKHNIPIRSNFSKSSFIEGVIKGYFSKLSSNKTDLEDNNSSLIWLGDKLLEEMYKARYPRTRTTSFSSLVRSGGFFAGKQKGENLKISTGLKDSIRNSNKLLA